MLIVNSRLRGLVALFCAAFGPCDAYARTLTLVPRYSYWNYVNYDTHLTSRSNARGLAAPVGFGENYISNTVASGYTQYGFNKVFTLDDDPAAITNLCLRVNYDDGFVAYLNGAEIARQNMPAGPFDWQTLASSEHNGGVYETIDVTQHTNLLVRHHNELDILVHQDKVASSDLVMDAEFSCEVSNELAADDLVEWLWAGAVTTNAIRINAKMRYDSTTVRAVLSTSPDLSAPLYSEFHSANALSNARVVGVCLSGLTPNTDYYYAMQAGGVTDTNKVGRFATLPAGPAAFTFAFGCGTYVASTNGVFEAIRQQDPAFFIHTGDFHYENLVNNVPEHYRLAFDTTLRCSAQAELYRNVAFAGVWDDHCFGGNNCDGTAAGRVAARSVYQQYVPHYPLPAGSGDVPVHQAWTVGRVRFLMCDLRSERTPNSQPDGPSKTMLGSTQKAWLKQEFLDAKGKYALIVWISPVSWISASGDDRWSGFATERAELANFIVDNEIPPICMLAGDAHSIAIDDGSNNNYADAGGPGFPVIQAGSLASGTSIKGGPYSHGAYAGRNQYALLSIADDGGTNLLVSASCKSNDSVVITYDFSVPVPLPQTRIVSIADTRGGGAENTNTNVLNRIIDEILALDPLPDAVTMAGDAVNDATDGYADYTNCMARLTAAGIPYYGAIGNHETGDTNWYNLWRDAMDFPSNGIAGHEEMVYYADAGCARIAVLDAFTDGFGWDKYVDGYTCKIGANQRDWLRSVAGTNSPMPFDLVVSHGVAYPVTYAHGVTLLDCLDQHPADRDAFLQCLSDIKAAVHLMGHEHLFLRRMIDTRYENSFSNTVPHISNVSGAGFHTSLISSIVDPDAIVLSTYNYTVIDLDPATRTGTATTYKDDGTTILDTVTLYGKDHPRDDSPALTTLVAKRAVWKYRDNGADLGSAWRPVSYDDSAWSTGAAVLGYGESFVDTEVAYGGDPNNKYITTYFRKRFALDAHPERVRSLLLNARYDDGFVAYINGLELTRQAMPTGAVSHATTALNHEGSSYEQVDLSAYRNKLVQGTNNMLAVELHQRDVTSSDLVFDIELAAQLTEPVLLVRKGDTWRYRKGTTAASDPPAAWRTTAFDQSDWHVGVAPFGYGPLSYATTLDMHDNYPSVCFRRVFLETRPQQISQLSLEVDYDDGFIAWLNGEEIARVNVQGGPGSYVAHNETCTGYVGANTTNWLGVYRDADLPELHSTNVLAVQLFNNTVGSGDAMLDAALAVIHSTLSAAEDVDADGLVDSWETRWFGATNALAGADQDADGLLNIEEFIAGSVPTNDASRCHVDVVLSNGNLLVTFLASAADGPDYDGYDRYFALEKRDGLFEPSLGSTGVWSGVAGYTRILGLDQTVLYTNPASQPVSFYRTRVWLE